MEGTIHGNPGAAEWRTKAPYLKVWRCEACYEDLDHERRLSDSALAQVSHNAPHAGGTFVGPRATCAYTFITFRNKSFTRATRRAEAFSRRMLCLPSPHLSRHNHLEVPSRFCRVLGRAWRTCSVERGKHQSSPQLATTSKSPANSRGGIHRRQ